jgi:hypothetical protein
MRLKYVLEKLFIKITRMIQLFEGTFVKNPLKHFSIRQMKVVWRRYAESNWVKM